jgi:hypothetical protein
MEAPITIDGKAPPADPTPAEAMEMSNQSRKSRKTGAGAAKADNTNKAAPTTHSSPIRHVGSKH